MLQHPQVKIRTYSRLRVSGCVALKHSAFFGIASNADARMVQELMGHKDLKTTQGYLHVAKSRFLHVVTPIDRMLGAVEYSICPHCGGALV